MNIQELIEKYEYLNHACFRRVDTNEVLRDLKQLDEPQKVVVEQFVDDYIKHAKEKGWDLQDLFEFVGDEDRGGLLEWFYDGCNQEKLALAWIFGYEVKKEKRYRVNVKNVRTRQGTLNRSKWSGAFIFSNPEENNLYGTKFTRKELEDAGFGWVFDCPGVEIEEVEG